MENKKNSNELSNLSCYEMINTDGGFVLPHLAAAAIMFIGYGAFMAGYDAACGC